MTATADRAGTLALSAPVDPDARDEAVILGAQTDAELTDQLLGVVLHPPPWIRPALLVTGFGALFLFVALAYTVATGIGVWGNNVPVAWAFAITNFVWWIGIGHAGTFISAFLLLLEQKWRTSINRFAEAMTLFAIVQAGLFPLLHMGALLVLLLAGPVPGHDGRLAPIPQLVDVGRRGRLGPIFSYVSLMFWYLGLVPDLGDDARDRAPERWRRRVYGIFALGWSGSAHEWSRYRVAYGLLGGFATPLVISVHSIVSMDFAIAQLPGWHSLIFPPYFRGGRDLFRLRDGSHPDAPRPAHLSPRERHHGEEPPRQHGEDAARHRLHRGLPTPTSARTSSPGTAGTSSRSTRTSSRARQGRTRWLSGQSSSAIASLRRCSWSKKVRTTPVLLWTVTIFVQIGMWFERYMLIVSSESRDFLPSSWRGLPPVDRGRDDPPRNDVGLPVPLPALLALRPLHPDKRNEGDEARATGRGARKGRCGLCLRSGSGPMLEGTSLRVRVGGGVALGGRRAPGGGNRRLEAFTPPRDSGSSRRSS